MLRIYSLKKPNALASKRVVVWKKSSRVSFITPSGTTAEVRHMPLLQACFIVFPLSWSASEKSKKTGGKKDALALNKLNGG